MDNKICTVCNIEKHINKFHKKYIKCEDCNIKRGAKRDFDNKNKISIQQKKIYEKKAINYYRSKVITETKETQTLKNCTDPMLNYKIN